MWENSFTIYNLKIIKYIKNSSNYSSIVLHKDQETEQWICDPEIYLSTYGNRASFSSEGNFLSKKDVRIKAFEQKDA